MTPRQKTNLSQDDAALAVLPEWQGLIPHLQRHTVGDHFELQCDDHWNCCEAGNDPDMRQGSRIKPFHPHACGNANELPDSF